MGDILYNLHRDGDSHTFICEHGHTHRIVSICKWKSCKPFRLCSPERGDVLGGRNQNRPMQTGEISTTL
jgi:hypothetical protein